MEFLFDEHKYTFLVTDKIVIRGITCPARLEVSVFNDKSIIVNEIIETPEKPVILNSARPKTFADFSMCFPEAATYIKEQLKYSPERYIWG